MNLLDLGRSGRYRCVPVFRTGEFVVLTYSVDLDTVTVMKTMFVSEFKAKCIGVLKEVQRSGRPVVVTLRGRPMARVEPFEGGKSRKVLGSLAGAMRVCGDLVRSDSSADWEMLD